MTPKEKAKELIELFGCHANSFYVFGDGGWEDDDGSYENFHKSNALKLIRQLSTPIQEQDGDYWKERCLMAEKLLEVSGYNPVRDRIVYHYNQWLEFKNKTPKQ